MTLGPRERTLGTGAGGRAWWILTQGWARNSPAHPGDSPLWAARPPGPGPHSAWASLLSGARLYLPEGCYSQGCHSGGSELQGVGGLSCPHLRRGREKGCLALNLPGIQRTADGLGFWKAPAPGTQSYLWGSLGDCAAQRSVPAAGGRVQKGCCPGRSSSQWEKAQLTSAYWGSFESQREDQSERRSPAWQPPDSLGG